jgi:hypothetical protein
MQWKDCLPSGARQRNESKGAVKSRVDPEIGGKKAPPGKFQAIFNDLTSHFEVFSFNIQIILLKWFGNTGEIRSSAPKHRIHCRPPTSHLPGQDTPT